MSIPAPSLPSTPSVDSILPVELWLRVCHHLNQVDLLSASRVSTALRAYTLNDSTLWSAYFGRIAWEQNTGCPCEVYGEHTHPDKPPSKQAWDDSEKFITTVTNTSARTEPWPYSFTRAYAELKLFVERSASQPFQLSLDIWCGLELHPELLSQLVDLIKSHNLCPRLVGFSLLSSNYATITALLDRALQHTTHLHDVAIDLRKSSYHGNGYLDRDYRNSSDVFGSIAPFLSGSLTTSTITPWWVAISPTPFAHLQTLRTSFVGALMFSMIPHIWPEVIEVVAYFNDDSLQNPADPAAVVRALSQLKRLAVIVYAQAFQPLSRGLLYPGETRHMERLDVLVKVNDPRPDTLLWMSQQPGLENRVMEDMKEVYEELRVHILRFLGEVDLETSSRATGLSDVEVKIDRFEPNSIGSHEPMNVVRARCKKTGRIRSVGLRDNERWPMSSFITIAAPAVWRALGGEDYTKIARVTELVVPVECLADLLRDATPQSVSRIRRLTLWVVANRLAGTSSDSALPELPALRTIVLSAQDGRSYSFTEVEGLIQPLALAAREALEEVQLLLERVSWTADELRRANKLASRVVGLPRS